MGLITAVQSGSFLKSGTGKSYLAMRIGELLDKSFSIEKVIFTPKDFVEAMEILEAKGRFSQVISIDEAGILVNARKWFSFVNKSISDVVMTFRTLRSMAIFVTPDVIALDKFVRWYVSHLFTTKKRVITGGKIRVYAKNYTLLWKEEARKYYRRKIIVYNRRVKRIVNFDRLKVNLPSEELIKAYEDRVEPFKRKIRTQIKSIEKEDLPYNWYLQDFFQHQRKLIKVSQKLGYRKHVYPSDLKDIYGITRVKAINLARKINERLENESTTEAS